MRRRNVVVALAFSLAAICQSALPTWAQPTPRSGSLSKSVFQPFHSPDRRFTLEYPKKDWLVLPGGGTVVLTLAQKKSEAAVVIERIRLNQTLAPDEITEVFAQLEAEIIRERHPSTTNLQTKLVDTDGRRLVVMEFSRRGVHGVEQVRQYSVLDGMDLYRLICSGTHAGFPKYESVFAHIAATFKITASLETQP